MMFMILTLGISKPMPFNHTIKWFNTHFAFNLSSLVWTRVWSAHVWSARFWIFIQRRGRKGQEFKPRRHRHQSLMRTRHLLVMFPWQVSFPSVLWKPGVPLCAEKERVRGSTDSSWIAQYSIWALSHKEINKVRTYWSTNAFQHSTRKIPSDGSHSIAHSNRLLHKI